MTTTSANKKHEILMGKYELGRLLGRGTFAKVYHARSLSSNSSVAVKVLDKPDILSSSNPPIAPLILREVSAMRRLSDHPNILKLHEVMATKSKIYLVMEHAKGGELFSRLRRRGPLPEPAARRYFQQLISALRFCHHHGVTHRDVKPENILLDSEGNLKLSDFGLSALPDQLRVDGMLHTACGTPAYTAPEVVRRKGYDGAKADAWSCGVILYVLLAGFLPFSDSNLTEMYKKIHRRDYKFPEWFTPSVKKVISKLLDPNPETRMSIDGLTDMAWIRRCYSVDDRLNLLDFLPPLRDEGNDHGNDPSLVTASSSSSSLNAFHIISMSDGLDLSGLFEEGGGGKRKRFTSVASLERILEKIEEVGVRLGYVIEKRKGSGVVGKGRWGSVLMAEVSEVAKPVFLVELKVDGVNGKGGLSWESLRDELGEVVFAWQKNGGEIHDSSV